jgi:site-specific DNA recombinase
MLRKARAGHVCGGQCFGYRNVEITAPGPDGRHHRQFVRREVEPDQAAVVRRIFELCAAGNGLKGITKTLNAEGATAPRNNRSRIRAWAPSSVREVLYREYYRGVFVWNRTARGTRGAAKQGKYADRPMSEWIRFELEDLVTDALWQAAHAQLTARRENYHALTRQDARRTIEARGGVEATCCRGLRPVRAVAAPFR